MMDYTEAGVKVFLAAPSSKYPGYFTFFHYFHAFIDFLYELKTCRSGLHIFWKIKGDKFNFKISPKYVPTCAQWRIFKKINKFE